MLLILLLFSGGPRCTNGPGHDQIVILACLVILNLLDIKIQRTKKRENSLKNNSENNSRKSTKKKEIEIRMKYFYEERNKKSSRSWRQGQYKVDVHVLNWTCRARSLCGCAWTPVLSPIISYPSSPLHDGEPRYYGARKMSIDTVTCAVSTVECVLF